MTLFAATVALGLMAGLFFAYANSVMPALRGADDRTVVDVMQRINRSILNPLFLLLFLGSLVVTAIAAVQHFGTPEVRWPLLAGLVFYAATLAITFVVNVPLNNRLDAAGVPDDPHRVRTEFFGRWVLFNHVRTLTCVGAFVAVLWSLIVHAGVSV